MYRAMPFLILMLATVVGAADSAATPNQANDSVQRALTLALLDEYNARDSYQGVIDRFGPVQPFGNILAAEERHISALVRHFHVLGLTIPQPDKKLRAAPTSLRDACRAAAEGERESVALYTRLLPMVTGQPEIESTFRNLQAASRDRHLPAFERCASPNTDHR
jgi:rubrerythrin